MTNTPDHVIDDVITQFLRTRSADPDRGLLDDIMRTVGATPQDRPWLGLRPILMLRLAVVTAVLIASLIGIRLFTGPSVGDAPGPSMTPEPSHAVPFVISGPTSGPGSTAVEPGTYRMRGPGESPAGWPSTVIVTIPDGWYAWSAVRGAGLVRTVEAPLAELNFSSVGNLIADRCTYQVDRGPLLGPSVGPSVNDLVAGLRSLPGLAFTEPVDTTLDGWHGKRLELTPPAACGTAALWLTPPGGGESWDVHAREGWHTTLRILDVDGLRFVVIAAYELDAPADVQLELQQMVDSIDIEP